MSTTLSQIQQQVQSLSHRTELAGSVSETAFINLALQILQTYGYYRPQLQTTQVLSPSVNNGDSGRLTIALPSNFRQFEDIVQLSPTFISGFGRPSIETANQVYRTVQTLTDTFFEAVVTDQTNLYFYPRYLAAQSYAAGYWTFELTQRIWLTYLVNAGDNNYLTNNAPHVIVYLTVVMELWYGEEREDALLLLKQAQEFADKFAISEYGESWSGTRFAIGEIEKMMANISMQKAGK